MRLHGSEKQGVLPLTWQPLIYPDMKKLLTLLAAGCLLAGAAQAQDSKAAPPKKEKLPYDSVLARRLGADDYGMHKYVMAFLKAGPTPSKDKDERARLQKAHMDNIGRMAEEGKLVVAGPFLDGGAYRGIYIFNVETVEEARKLTESDPLIKSGGLEMELHPWYGSAYLIEAVKMHDRVAKKGF